jgi:hypothetical protein
VATATAIQINLLNEDRAFVEYWITLAFTIIPENSGNLDCILKCVEVRKTQAAIALQVFSMGNIVGCVQGMPDIATSSQTGDGQKK